MYGIKGLLYIPNYLPEAKAQTLINRIDQLEWDTTLKRRTMQFGYSYDYQTKELEGIGNMPDFIRKLTYDFIEDGVGDGTLCNQAIANEYLPGQGISRHTDHEKLFSTHVISLSLGSTVPMVFRPKGYHTSIQTLTLYLEPCSLLILSGAARYDWTHEIAPRQYDLIPEKGRVTRKRRISLTFRRIHHDYL